MPWSDWQFWIVTLIGLWGLWSVFRIVVPKKKGSACTGCASGSAAAKPKRVKLTVGRPSRPSKK